MCVYIRPTWTLWHLKHIMGSSQILYFPLSQLSKCHSEFQFEQNVWAKIWLNDVRESQSSLHWVKQNNASGPQGAHTQSTEADSKIRSDGSRGWNDLNKLHAIHCLR